MGRKNGNGGKPGMVLYFDTYPALQRLSNEQRGRLLMGIMEYAQFATAPNFQDDITLDVVWSMIRPRIDADDKRYQKTVIQKRYAGYVSKRKAKNMDVLEFKDWLERVQEEEECTDADGWELTLSDADI